MATWHGHDSPPPRYIMGSHNNNPWAVANNRDFYGETILGPAPGGAVGGIAARTIEPNHKAARWVRENPDYRTVGWNSVSNKPVIRNFSHTIAAYRTANPLANWRNAFVHGGVSVPGIPPR